MIALYFDVVCPYAYLAFTQLPALAQEAGRTLQLRPILLGGLMGTLEASPPRTEGPKHRMTQIDLRRRAAWLGQRLEIPEAHPRRTVDAMRLLVAVEGPQRLALARALFEAYWLNGEDIADRAVLQRLATPFSLDVAAAVADPAVRQRLFSVTEEAHQAGVFGVPTVAVDDTLWWGVDRLDFVRAQLGLSSEAPRVGPRRGATLELFHDLASPFAYLASTQIERLAAEAGASLTWTPILLGALFRSIGTPMVPLHSFSAPRRAWMSGDVRRWADRWGVPFRFPSHFPLRTVTALRVTLVQPKTTGLLYRAAWEKDRDIGDPEVLRDVLDAGGFPGETLIEQTQDPQIKAQLRANTERAEALGVVGVPTVLVDGADLFWGQDRLDQVTEAATRA